MNHKFFSKFNPKFPMFDDNNKKSNHKQKQREKKKKITINKNNTYLWGNRVYEFCKVSLVISNETEINQHL